MLLTISILILAYMVMGKDIKPLIAKAKNVDWRKGLNDIWLRIEPWATKVGRVTARPVLQCFYVLKSENLSTTERMLIYAAIAYTVLPSDLLPRATYKLLGILDDGVALMYAYHKIKDKITPEINNQVEDTLNNWFGVEYEMVE